MAASSDPDRGVAAADRTEDQARAQIAEAEQAEAEQGRAARAASLFDLRRVIAGVFLLYGAVLTVMGVAASTSVKTKAAGININLWTGLAMLAVGIVFLAWALLRPLQAEDLDSDRPRVE